MIQVLCSNREGNQGGGVEKKGGGLIADVAMGISRNNMKI